MADDYSNKRRFPRIPSENPVLVKKLYDQKVSSITKTQVVGMGGCMFESDKPLGVGSLLTLMIAVHERFVKAKARVVYENPKTEDKFEIGVEFLEVDSMDRIIIEALLASHDDE